MFPDPIPLNLSLDFRATGAEVYSLQNFEPEQAPKSGPTKVLVIDDLSAMRNHMLNLLKRILPGALDLAEASNLLDATSLVAAKCPDLVILDVLVGKNSSFKLAENIWQIKPQTKLLFWSREHKAKHMRELDRLRKDSTVFGYILKDEPDEKLAYAIECIVLHDNIYIHPSCRVSRIEAHRQVDLSDAELETLHDVAIGLTDRAISLRRHISVRGVQSRISGLQVKVLRGECSIVNGHFGIELLNQRSRLVFEAFRLGLIDIDEVRNWSGEYFDWLQAQVESTA